MWADLRGYNALLLNTFPTNDGCQNTRDGVGIAPIIERTRSLRSEPRRCQRRTEEEPAIRGTGRPGLRCPEVKTSVRSANHAATLTRSRRLCHSVLRRIDDAKT